MSTQESWTGSGGTGEADADDRAYTSSNLSTIRTDLLPGTRKAMRIVKEIRLRIDMSWRTISQNFDLWDDIEEHYRIFRPADSEDKESLRKNQVQKIIVPIQFATIQTMVTFLMEVFTSLKPVLKVSGSDPASMRPARVMELLLAYDYKGNRGYLQMHQWFMNMFRYGYGIMENSWGKRIVTKRIMKPGPGSILEIDGLKFKTQGALDIARDYFTTFEGNKWQIIDNRYFYPDPRYPLTRFQEGEFCARRTFIHDNDLRKMEDEGLFFNTSKIETFAGMGGGVRDTETGSLNSQRDRITAEGAFQRELMDAKKNRMHIDEQIIIEINPREWGLGELDQPEDWLFNLIDGTTLVRAEPSPFLPRFPYSIVECYPDILAYISPGLMELTEPLAAHMNFLFNSHMANVRKAINDTFLVDPSKVDLRDLLDPAAGKIVRLLPLAYGQDPSQFVKQLAVTDITQGHIQDIKSIMDLWNRIMGTSDAMFGQVSPGRRVAADVQGAMKQAGSRMKMLADLASSEGVAPLTEMMAISRQENMTKEQYVELVGRTAQELGVDPKEILDGYLRARRGHIDGVFDYPAEEGVIPQDRANAAQILQQMFQAVAKSPFLQQAGFDPVEIFKETIRQSGMRGLDEFMRRTINPQTQMMQMQDIQNGVAKGQLSPFNGRPDEGARSDEQGLTMDGFLNGAGAPRAAA